MKIDAPTAIIIGAVIIATAIVLSQPAQAAAQPVINVQFAAPTFTFQMDTDGLWRMNNATGDVELLQV